MNNWATNDEFTTNIRMSSFVYSLRFVIRNLILTFRILTTFGTPLKQFSKKNNNQNI